MDVSDAPDMPRRVRVAFFFAEETDISNPKGSGFVILFLQGWVDRGEDLRERGEDSRENEKGAQEDLRMIELSQTTQTKNTAQKRILELEEELMQIKSKESHEQLTGTSNPFKFELQIKFGSIRSDLDLNPSSFRRCAQQRYF